MALGIEVRRQFGEMRSVALGVRAPGVRTPATMHGGDPPRQRGEHGEEGNKLSKSEEVALLGVLATLQLAWFALLLYGAVELHEMVGLFLRPALVVRIGVAHVRDAVAVGVVGRRRHWQRPLGTRRAGHAGSRRTRFQSLVRQS